jgi:magnesium-protoporphyrin O-methyltransferase
VEDRTDPIAKHFDRKADCCAGGASCAEQPELIAVTRMMLDALADVGLEGRSVLDVGCGQGPFSLAVLQRGATRVTGVDLSASAVDVARRRLEAHGFADRSAFVVGDAAAVELARHDIVVLNRVVCCYPDSAGLLRASLALEPEVFGVILPESKGFWGLMSRIALRGENLLRVFSRDPFRAYIHPVERVAEAASEAGLSPVHRARRTVWRVDVYARSQTRKPVSVFAGPT